MKAGISILITMFIVCLPAGLNAVQENRDPLVYTGPYLGQTPPGQTPERFAPRYFDHGEGYHSAVSFSPDLQEMIWSPMSRTSSVSYARMTNGVWSEPQQLTFGCSEGVGDAVFSPDGQRIYFVSFQSPEIGARGMERIWYAERAGDGWSPARLTHPAISDHPTHWTLSMARSGTIYFTSEIAGVRGEQDIYCARRSGSGYAEAQNLGPAINSDGKDLTPCIAPDEQFLIFSRIGAGTRKTDLHISFRRPDGGWTDAVDMGPEINSDHHDLAPCLSPDGKYLFFVSNRAGENWIYWVDASVTERFRPHNIH